MSTEPEPNQSASPAKGEGETPKNQDAAAKDAAAKALGQAKESVAAGLATFKKLDQFTQIYLGGLAVAVLCALFFAVISMTVTSKLDGPMAEMMKKKMAEAPSYSAFSADNRGKLAVLAAVAGIGLWAWNFMAKKKEAWVPIALASAAGLSTLMFLLLWLSAGKSSADAGIVKIEASFTFLGFWLPFAGAIAATVVSVKRIMNPASASATQQG